MSKYITSNNLKKAFPFFKDLNLKPREIKFVYNYVNSNFNKKFAFKNSGYKNYIGKDGIKNAFCVLRKNHNLDLAIVKYLDATLEDSKGELKQRICEVYARRAFYDILVFVEANGNFKNLNDIPEEWRVVIDSVEVKFYGKDADRRVVISKLADRDKALDKLDKYVGLTAVENTTVNNNLIVMSKETEDKLKNTFMEFEEREFEVQD